jgi:peptide/nickel transport system permease protein
VIVAVFLLCAAFGEWLAPHDPYAGDISNDKLLGPSLQHPMGTDEIGRDVFSRLIVGARISLRVAFVVLSIAVIVGRSPASSAGWSTRS